MKKLLLSACLLASLSPFAQTYQPTPENLQARAAFQQDRFGMFIHWGASSVLGDGEWVMTNRNIHVTDYNRLQHLFNPIDFDADTWVSIAKNAGMKYITFITRHHDSFSNWDTKFSDWKITHTPFKRDVLKELSAACQKQGIKLFLYYSLLDWYRTDYQYWTGRTGQGTGRTERGDWNQYIAFMKNQLTELLTNYGPIAGIWFDGHWDQVTFNESTQKWEGGSKVDWHYDEIYGLIHRLQPQALIGNNHHLAPIPGEDFQMFERDLPGHNTTGWGSDASAVSSLPLETCETINGSWGFNITDGTYKSKRQVIQLLAKDAGLGANLLLNIGPMPNGQVQPEFVRVLDSVGQWMQKQGESIYATSAVDGKLYDWGTSTKKGNLLYLHVFDSTSVITLDKLPFKKVISATYLANGQKAHVVLKKGVLQVSGITPADPDDTVIKISLQ